MHYYDDNEKEKPSWSDLDKRNNRSRHVDRDDRERSERPRKTSYAQKQYKKKLEEFFSVGKEKEDRKKQDELKKIMDIKNRSAYMKAADQYIEKNGMPKHLDFLLSMLDHKESEKILESIKLIEELYKDETETRQDIIRQKINILEMTASDPKVQGLAEETLERMKE